MERKVKKNILIISGGSLDLAWAKAWLAGQCFDYVIAADSGLEYADALNIKTDFLLGDYDSVDGGVLARYQQNTDMVTYPREKDYTDTHIALLRAIEMGAEHIALLGATGTRYDHAMTNIFILKQALASGVSAAIFDAYNKIYLADGNVTIQKEQQYGRYLSFAPMTEQVKLSVSGVKYPLKDFTLEQGLSLCQSNEITEEAAEIQIQSGILIVFETRDENRIKS